MDGLAQLTTASHQRKMAIYSGISIVLMTIIASFSFGVLDSLAVSNDPLLTFNNLSESKTLFFISVLGWGVIVVLDLIVSFTFYLYFRSKDEKTSMVMGILRLIYTVFLFFAILNLFEVLSLLDEKIDIVSPSSHQQILLLINDFNSIWSNGLIIFGIHIFLLGLLVYQSTIPKILAILLFLASLGYIVVHGGNLLFPIYKEQISSIESIFILPMVLGELGLAIWLLVKGGKKV